ncbi:hypothetical protein [Streptomyces sp. NBC_00094]|uniref:hypothetical protein n=1 Tax=Streptomyces sp. NBC_00094 TaxID=2903620 RepID=UPI00224F66E6|nr:hypothetical protein [Streptomyces sp. NBC_00094]MCX5392075.1 hypothetical protein [Streptomyces sp. NBC_00094]
MFRTTRALAAFAALAGLVLALLVCGTATSAPLAPPGTKAVAAAVVPGCGPGHAADVGASGPLVPPRASGFAELLPALAADRTPCAVRHGEPGGRGAGPGREPPERVPPSPVELSILMRV